MKQFKKIIPWLPFAATVVCAIVTCVLYVLNGMDRGALGFVWLFGCMLLPAIIPVFNLIFKRPLPFVLGIVIAVQAVLGNFVGSILGGYNKIPWLDLLMHGMFGFTGAVIAYALIVRWNGEKLSKLGFVLYIFAFVMACAVVWEISEYLSDGLIGGNAQKFKDPATDAEYVGRAALADTMEDVMITLAGLAVFYIAMLADKLTNKHILKKLLVDPQNIPQNKVMEMPAASVGGESAENGDADGVDGGEDYNSGASM